MKYLFLEKDAIALRNTLDDIEKERVDLAKDAAINVSQSSETFHDNAGFEVALREQMSLAKKSSDLRAMLGEVEVVNPSNKVDRVRVGVQITLKDLESKKENKYAVSSYMILDQKFSNEVSYSAPVIEAFMGKKIGAKKSVSTPGGHRSYQLVGIEAPSWA